ncbi:RNA polymerase sigma factor [Propionibacteriaceae bacterium G1746]|uniref:RNA polymerase sigma factor n=1 Tax=Aestuariimicrobium sp. G57 TaxID=3418485 RepID=UPI003C214930
MTSQEPGTTLPRSTSLPDVAAAAFADYRSGQTGRMSDLVRLVSPALWALARSQGLASAQAEDVVQTVWVRLVQKSETIRDGQAVLAWLLTTTRREAWRTAQHQAPSAPSDILVQVVSDEPTPESVVAERDTNARLWWHVQRLSPRCQALLRVIAFAAVPDYAGISEALGMPVGSIGPTRGRCLATLRKTLANDPHWSPA